MRSWEGSHGQGQLVSGLPKDKGGAQLFWSREVKITCIFLTVPDSSHGNDRSSIRGVPLKTGRDRHLHLHPKPQPQRNRGRLEVEVTQKWACHLGRRLIPWTPHLLLSPQGNAKEIPCGILETGVRVKYRPEAHLSLFYLYPFALNLALRCLSLSPA